MGITFLQLPNLKVACAMLWIFYFYDFFWVFLSPYVFGGKSVMETVALELVDPNKVTRPLPIALEIPYVFRDGFQLIGLGDIVLPGVFIALLLRFDKVFTLNPSKRADEFESQPRFPRIPYFPLGMVCYTLGLYTCLTFLIIYNTAQPALIYLGKYL